MERPALARKPVSTRLGSGWGHSWFALLASFGLLLTAPAGCISDIELPAECPLDNGCAGISERGGQASFAGETVSNGGLPGDSSPPDAGTGGTAGGVDPQDAGAGEAGAPACRNCTIAPLQLPNPCGKDHYSTSISVIGGTAPYQWRIDPPAANWRIEPKPNSTDSSQALLVGDPSGPTQLTITATDSVGYVSQKSYSVAPRSACYFAYVAASVDGAKLSLRDAMLGIDKTTKLAQNAGVHDFRFSPDGRFLAYRYGADVAHPAGAHLSLFDFSSMQDHSLELQDGAVTAYAWSPDSKVLAVALNAGDQSELLAVRLSPTSTGTEIAASTATISDDPIESDLYWVGTEFVGFYSANTPDLSVPPDRTSIFYAPLTVGGFAAPVAITDLSYKAGIVVAPAPGGLFVTAPNDRRSTFNAIEIDGAYAVNHVTNFIDPAGNLSASVVDETLNLFQAANNDTVFEQSSAAAQFNCPKLLSWAQSRERIACVAHVSLPDTSWGELRIFDVGTVTPRELTPSIVKGSCLKDAGGTPLAGSCSRSEYDYDELTSVSQPRLLSPKGDWLAFVTGPQNGASAALYWADLRTKPMTLTRRVEPTGMAAGAPVALAFSASERYLLHQNGNQLKTHLLTGGAQDHDDLDIEDALDAAPVAPCSDDFVTAPARWCGGANASPSFVWSPDRSSEIFAYRRPGQLVVVELTANTFTPHELAAPPCNDSCSGQFGFQPPLP